MVIAYVHGYGSDAKTSITGQRIKKCFPDEKILSLGYDYMKPHKAAVQLSRQIKDWDIELIIGASLGGFWARYLANKYNIPLMLLNPSLDPANSLRIRNTYEEEDLEAFDDYTIHTDKPALPITLVIGMADGIIDPKTALDKYKGRAAIIQTKDGHQIKTPNLKDYITNAINNISDV